MVWSKIIMRVSKFLCLFCRDIRLGGKARNADWHSWKIIEGYLLSFLWDHCLCTWIMFLETSRLWRLRFAHNFLKVKKKGEYCHRLPFKSLNKNDTVMQTTVLFLLSFTVYPHQLLFFSFFFKTATWSRKYLFLKFFIIQV